MTKRKRQPQPGAPRPSGEPPCGTSTPPRLPAAPGARKRPFDVEAAMPLLRQAVAGYPKAALFELAGEGFSSVFELLIACIIS